MVNSVDPGQMSRSTASDRSTEFVQAMWHRLVLTILLCNPLTIGIVTSMLTVHLALSVDITNQITGSIVPVALV